MVGDGPPKEKDVRLGSVDHVMDPAPALLHADAAPLHLRHQLPFGHQPLNVRRQLHVPTVEDRIL